MTFPTSLVPADATAVVFNLTGTGSTGPTYLAVGSLAGPSPNNTSNLNLAGGETRANLVTSPIGGAGQHGVWLEAGPGAVDAIVDLAGYYSPSTGAKFTSVAPQRVLDTRDSAPLGPGGTVTLDLSGQVPAGATSAVFNLTGTDVTGSTFVTAYPAGQGKPDASNLNLEAGQTSPNLVTVQLSADRKVTLANAHSSVDLIADLAGYYSPDSRLSFFPLQQLRAVDTRDTNGNPRQPLGPGGTHSLNFSGFVPDGASAAVYNLTATNVTGSTYLTAWPDFSDRPSASNLNLEPGQTSANMAITTLGTDAKAQLFNHVGQVDAIADLTGYFAVAKQPCASACVYTWGQNQYGQKADGTTDNALHTPTAAYGLSGVTAVTTGPFGSGHGYALLSDGTVWDWGSNSAGELANGRPGGYGDGPVSTTQYIYPPSYYSTTPGKVFGLSGITQITGGYALRNDGTVWAWGSNYMWSLGNGVQDENYLASTAVQVTGLTNVVAIAGSTGDGYALKSDGTVWAWGQNVFGELGTGVAPDPNKCSEGEGISPKGPNCASATPVQVANLNNVVKIGDRLAIKSDGTVWQWGGENSNYQGDPNVHQVPGVTGAVAVAGRAAAFTDGTAYALMPDGTVRAWGMNSDGELGNGTKCQGGLDNPCTPVTDPVTVSGLTGVTTLASGNSIGYALKSDGTVWAWGSGYNGALGDGQRFTSSLVPVRIAALSGVTALGDGGIAVANP
ncbi:RCC1 domain-containing protein [Kutzneria sp. NPDC052558]|uniref:RCC1 domain-containing protein n=1 Tax=Kutzneria sp. NPDC052558 TaxID=3364121 RepID=UPI0037C61FEA